METALRFIEGRYPLIYALLTHRLGATILVAAAFFLCLQWGFYARVIIGSDDLVTSFGKVVGGDFVVFWQAATTAAADKAALYDFATHNARLEKAFSAQDGFGLGWQYPPTMFLYLAPLGAVGAHSYPLAYALWLIAGAAGFFAVAARIWPRPRALLILAAAPALFQTAITGQTGLFTAALIGLACLYADKRPIIAGVACGLLTVKPQLGLLLPIALAAGGSWRAFAVATATSLMLALASYGLYGEELWRAFLDAMRAHGERMGQTIFPVHKLTTPYGAAMTIGLPPQIAAIIQSAAFLCLAAFTAFVWRRTRDAETRLIVTASAVVLAAPYVFYYELPIVALALFALARKARASGRLPLEGPALAILWIAPMTMPGDGSEAYPIVAAASIAAFALAARRVLREIGASDKGSTAPVEGVAAS